MPGRVWHHCGVARRTSQLSGADMAALEAPLTADEAHASAGAPLGSSSRAGAGSVGGRRGQLPTNLLAGLTTSFAAIALGAAFGDASGRGALVGILSAGTIAVVTAAAGGTRVQCSGPTAPMTVRPSL